MLDVGDVLFLNDDLMNIRVIIASVSTEMLLHDLRVRPRDNKRDQQIVSQPFVMGVGAAHTQGQRRTALVDQEMHFAALFTTVSRIPARFLPTKRSRRRFAVDRLPVPADLTFSLVKSNHRLHQPFKDPLFPPCLKSRVNNAAGHAEPFLGYRLPLTACPQDIPNTVKHRPVVGSRPSRASACRSLWQMMVDALPQFIRNLKVINKLRLFSVILVQDVSPGRVSLGKPILPEIRLFTFFG